MANQIFYNPQGYIEVIIEGDQTYITFDDLKADAIDLVDQLQKQGQPVLALIDVSRQGNFTPDSNRAAMQILEALNYDRVAIIGAQKVLGEVTKAIILAMSKSANTKVFTDRQSALDWLLPPQK